jgi:hypothetical protein
VEPDRRPAFYVGLHWLVADSPIHVLGCVVDRPGYNARRREPLRVSAILGLGKWPIMCNRGRGRKRTMATIRAKSSHRGRSIGYGGPSGWT